MTVAEKFTFQTRPTAAQNAAMVRANRARYARQYADNQPAFVEPEPVNFCAVPTPGEDGEPQVWERVGSTPVLIILALACVAWAGYWSFV